MRRDLGSVDDLRSFLRIIDCGSMSAAAREERVSVNAISQRLRRLEERLDVRLLTRTTRLARPTDEGLLFAEHCRRGLAALDEGARELQREERGLTGRVCVVVHIALVQAAVLSALERVLRAHPGLQVELRTVAAVEGGPSFDVGLWVGPVALRTLRVRRVGHSRWALAASHSYVKARGAPVSPSELHSHECLRSLRSPRERTWTLANERGQRATVALGGRFEANDTEALRQAILSGIGIGLRPAQEVRRAALEGRLIHILPAWSYDPLPVSILAPEGRLKVARVRAVADALAGAARSLD